MIHSFVYYLHSMTYSFSFGLVTVITQRFGGCQWFKPQATSKAKNLLNFLDERATPASEASEDRAAQAASLGPAHPTEPSPVTW